MSKKNKQKQNNTPVSTGGPPVRVVKSMPGLMTCVFNHVTSSTTADFDWTGQPLNDIWPQVLAFLKWTQDTYRSESQLRLFVNKNTGEWKAWAFPQKANLGMSAKELDERDEGYERTKEQRAQFADTDGWYYWGTVHHHCTASAFQSGTDRDNERNQDGIHITVGHLDRTHYDIDFRVYVGGYKLTSLTPLDFWDIGNEMDSIPPLFRELMPKNTDEMLAKHQMGRPAPAGTEFPEIWKENIIDCTPKAVVSTPSTVLVGGNGGSSGSRVGVFGRTYIDKAKPKLHYDLCKCERKLKEYLTQAEDTTGASIKTMEEAILVLDEIERRIPDEAMNLFAICVECDILPGDLTKFIEEQQAMIELQQEMQGFANEGGHAPPTVHTAGRPAGEHWYYPGHKTGGSQPQQQQYPGGHHNNHHGD